MTDTTDVRIALGQVAGVHALPLRALDDLAACGTGRAVGAGTTLANEGDDATYLYVVIEGRVAIDTHTPGDGTLVLETLGRGELVGWSWLVPPHRWRFAVRAVDDTDLVEIDAAALRDRCIVDPELGFTLARHVVAGLAARLEATRLRLLDLYAPPPGGR